MFRQITLIAILLSIIVILSGCAGKLTLLSEQDLRKVLEKCEFELKSIDAEIEFKEPKVTFKGIQKPELNVLFHVKISAKNNSLIPIAVSKLDLMVFADSEPIPDDASDPTATGSVSRRIRLPIGRTVTIPMDVRVPALKGTKEFVKIIKEKKVHYRVDGTFYFQCIGYEIPVTIKMTEN
ncbi:MAG: LEA type 2 family protein [Candidatus Hatepunaea meridiana]|nr:LEA type 2 family protein [Candidatus Hatepunaea meridiana]